MQNSPAEITALVGREVYSNNGVFVGEIEDIRVNFDKQQVTGLALHQVNMDLLSGHVGNSRGVLIPYRWVRSVGDVVLINNVVERLSARDEDDSNQAHSVQPPV